MKDKLNEYIKNLLIKISKPQVVNLIIALILLGVGLPLVMTDHLIGVLFLVAGGYLLTLEFECK